MRNDESKRYELLKKIYSETGIMLEAIKVDQFDIFEQSLQGREPLMLEFKEMLINEGEILSDTDEGLLYEKVKQMNTDITEELKRFQKTLENEAIQNKRELNAVIQGQKKTNQYHLRTKGLSSGIHFDNKK